MMEWSLIETAPRDGTWILGWADYWGMSWPVRWRYNDRINECYFTGSEEWDDYTCPEENYLNPTHWMPMPEPPLRIDVMARMGELLEDGER
jgi:hypothetical protein